VLLTGDIERLAEQKLLSRYRQELTSTVLIAPHHGSITSSSIAFITAVEPQYVLFSVGHRNRFGFPKQDIIDRYAKRDIKMLDTAKSGAIEISFNNSGIIINEYRQMNKRFWHSMY